MGYTAEHRRKRENLLYLPGLPQNTGSPVTYKELRIKLLTTFWELKSVKGVPAASSQLLVREDRWEQRSPAPPDANLSPLAGHFL